MWTTISLFLLFSVIVYTLVLVNALHVILISSILYCTYLFKDIFIRHIKYKHINKIYVKIYFL